MFFTSAKSIKNVVINGAAAANRTPSPPLTEPPRHRSRDGFRNAKIYRWFSANNEQHLSPAERNTCPLDVRIARECRSVRVFVYSHERPIVHGDANRFNTVHCWRENVCFLIGLFARTRKASSFLFFSPRRHIRHIPTHSAYRTYGIAHLSRRSKARALCGIIYGARLFFKNIQKQFKVQFTKTITIPI